MAQTQKPFLIAIGVIILAGAAFIGLRMTKSNVSIPANPIVTTADTAGFSGYLLGSPDAPIEITEYADFQCPGCGAFATVQFPDIKVRLIDAGKVLFRYRDFPLDGIHRHARIASHTAACADDQGKFWDVEHRIYSRQNDWAFQSDALPVMEEIIREAGLDHGAWMSCMQSAKHAGRIQASYDEGVRVGVPETPTFRIEGRLYTGLSADGMVRLVDSLIAAKAAATQQAPRAGAVTEEQGGHSGKAVGGLALAALGVVYGDIGTSPLYALKEAFHGPHAVDLTHDNVLGILSLVFWSLNFVVSFKYIGLVMRAHNRGEGGILALLALVRPGGQKRGRGLIVIIGLFGAALLYGDGIITPAISVLGAVEGLEVATPIFKPWIMPLAVVIITALFAVQSRGTAGIGRIFGPMTTLWFVCIALLGIRGIAMQPEVLYAVNPWYAFEFFLRESWHGVAVLGAVVLVITGGEALYADMGHFGPRPIRLAWFAVVLPALALNYFGQGAWLLEHPDALLGETFNPFFGLVPEWALYPMIVIATAAAVVASQALISGAFSLTQQAIQLGFVPRMRIIHTSISEKGQIYMPGINWALWAACIGLVIALPSSTKLAATYGVAVTGAMLTTTLLFAIVMRRLWHWPMWRVVAVTTVFAVVDAAFLSANVLKIPAGGWFPIIVAACVFLLMRTWKKGRRQITAILRESSLPLDLFVPDIGKKKVQRVAGTAVFMTSIPDVASPVLLHHLKHNKVLHERVIMVTVQGAEIPTIPEEERVTVEAKGEGFYQVIATYGFTESPDVPALLLAVGESLREPGDTTRRKLRMQDVSFYLGRETLVVTQRGPDNPRTDEQMTAWRARLFALMTKNAQSATAYFGLPPNRVIELGAQIQV